MKSPSLLCLTFAFFCLPPSGKAQNTTPQQNEIDRQIFQAGVIAPVVIKHIKPLIPNRPINFLEINSGAGGMSLHFAKSLALKSQITVLEDDPALRDYAKNELASIFQDFSIKANTIDHLKNMEPKQNDIVFITWLLDDLDAEKSEALLNKAIKTLRPEGRLVIIASDYTRPDGFGMQTKSSNDWVIPPAVRFVLEMIVSNQAKSGGNPGAGSKAFIEPLLTKVGFKQINHAFIRFGSGEGPGVDASVRLDDIRKKIIAYGTKETKELIAKNIVTEEQFAAAEHEVQEARNIRDAFSLITAQRPKGD